MPAQQDLPGTLRRGAHGSTPRRKPTQRRHASKRGVEWISRSGADGEKAAMSGNKRESVCACVCLNGRMGMPSATISWLITSVCPRPIAMHTPFCPQTEYARLTPMSARTSALARLRLYLITGLWHRHIKSERGTNSQRARGAHNLR
jgi:hypothetical protein